MGNVRIACVDVDYRDTAAVAAGLWFCGWGAPSSEHQAVASFRDVAEYEPGAFYRRELPCLLGILARGPRAEVVVVDGYVWLADGAPGLGAHLHAAIGGVVVGVAKTRFAGATDAQAVCRGGSRSPLFVSAVGMPVEDAAKRIAEMHGPHRVPTLLRQVDALARSAPADSSSGIDR
jgi:deoxyribonuclease V